MAYALSCGEKGEAGIGQVVEWESEALSALSNNGSADRIQKGRIVPLVLCWPCRYPVQFCELI